MDKEIKYIFREPLFKAMLMRLVYFLCVWAFAFFQPGSRHSVRLFGPYLVWGAMAVVLLSENGLLFNVFGTEGHASSALFLFPGERREILMGKNIALFVALSVTNLVFVAILAAFTGALSQLPVLFGAMTLGLVVCTGVGNILSIWFPMRVVVRGWRVRPQSAGKGCSFGILYLLGSAAAFGLLVPLVAAFLAPVLWLPREWYALTIPLALAYSLGVYLLSLRLGAPLLLSREVEIITALSRED